MLKSNHSYETKQKILISISELMDEMPVNKVTVTKVCNKAGINRSTFYDYFKSLDDAIPFVNHRIIKDFTNILTTNSRIDDKFLLELFTLIYDNKEAFANYYQLENKLVFTNYFALLYEEFKRPNGEMVAELWDAGLNRMIKSWLLKYPNKKPEDILHIFIDYLDN